MERRAENEASVLRRLVELMLEYQNHQLKEQARETFWKNVRWFAVAICFALLAVVNLLGLSKLSGMGNLPMPIEGEYAAQVSIEGMIAPGKPASADHIVEALQDAFADEKAKGILLRINSPGGTPVQSAIIYREIRRLRAQHPDKKVIAVAEDMMASGAYYIASAADEIYANENSIVGSIGVKMETYGAVDLARKIGIERRIFTAGEHKVRLDPLVPVSDDDRKKLRHTLEKLHANFIGAVKEGRGDRLKGNDRELFSGDFWTADEAKEFGMIDGINTPYGVLKEIFGVEQVRDYSPAPGLFTRLLQTALSLAGIESAAGVALPYYSY